MNEQPSKKYSEDPRTSCKYGLDCYQKNTNHLNKYKHPPQPIPCDAATETPSSPPPKKRKVEENSVQESPDNTICENTSESDESEEEDLPDSPKDIKENLKQKFLVDFPQDFFDLYEFCSKRNPNSPSDSLSLVGLMLCGPYDLISNKNALIKSRKASSYLCHWRFYHDPPEFQTVITGTKDEFHIGYFRDDPSDLPSFVASMSSKKAGCISQLGENIFAALYQYLDSEVKNCDVFKKCSLQKLLKDIEEFAKEKNHSLDLHTTKTKKRMKQCAAKSFHSAGILVPVDKETDVGYREIPETNASLKKILQKIANSPTVEAREKNFETLQEILTNVQWANDEGDFGMGLELGIDLLMFGGKEFHSAILHLLTVAYELLNRPQFAQIIKAHLKDRKKGSNMSRLF